MSHPGDNDHKAQSLVFKVLISYLKETTEHTTKIEIGCTVKRSMKKHLKT